ncbi:MAG: NAD-dependent epimerase/dehydratase family protein, partial [Anaerolineales bacterium]
AAGFIGRALVARLLREGSQVTAFDLAATPPAGWGDRVHYAAGDVRHPQQVQQALGAAATIFHLAAITLDAGTLAQHRAVTVEGTRHVMQTAAQTGAKVILTSSIVCYGERLQEDIDLDEDLAWGKPTGFYSTCKQEQERLAREMSARHGTPLVVVRPGNVYGPGSPQWVQAALNELRRGTPSLIGGGQADANLVYVENLMEALMLAASNPAAVGRAYNVADGFGVTWLQYFGDLARLGGAPRPRAIPFGLARALAAVIEPAWRGLGLGGRPPITYEAVNLVGARARHVTTRAQTELGFRPVVDYAQALDAIQSSL